MKHPLKLVMTKQATPRKETDVGGFTSAVLAQTLRNYERGLLVNKVFDITPLINVIWVVMGYY